MPAKSCIAMATLLRVDKRTLIQSPIKVLGLAARRLNSGNKQTQEVSVVALAVARSSNAVNLIRLTVASGDVLGVFSQVIVCQVVFSQVVFSRQFSSAKSSLSSANNLLVLNLLTKQCCSVRHMHAEFTGASMHHDTR